MAVENAKDLPVVTKIDFMVVQTVEPFDFRIRKSISAHEVLLHEIEVDAMKKLFLELLSVLYQ